MCLILSHSKPYILFQKFPLLNKGETFEIFCTKEANICNSWQISFWSFLLLSRLYLLGGRSFNIRVQMIIGKKINKYFSDFPCDYRDFDSVGNNVYYWISLALKISFWHDRAAVKHNGNSTQMIQQKGLCTNTFLGWHSVTLFCVVPTVCQVFLLTLSK